MLRLTLLVLVLFSLTVSCTRRKARVRDEDAAEEPAGPPTGPRPVSGGTLRAGAPGAAGTEAAGAPGPRKGDRDPHLQQIVKVSLQADQIVREAWWVVANDRPGVSRSPFGKMQRAASQALDGKLSSKGLFECDNYVFTKEALSDWTATFTENCGHSAPKEIARWTFTNKDPEAAGRANVLFFSSNLREVLGMSASLFSSRITCDVSWDEKGFVETLSCPQWQQDRGNQLVKLATFEYQKSGGALLRLRGQVLENLQPVRKIDAKVPLEGKITVVETELVPAPVAPVAAAPASKTSSVRGAGASSPAVAGAAGGAVGVGSGALSTDGPGGTGQGAVPQRRANMGLAAPGAAPGTSPGAGPVGAVPPGNAVGAMGPGVPATGEGEAAPPQLDPVTGLPLGSMILPNGDVWVPSQQPTPPTEAPTSFAPAPVPAPAPPANAHLGEPDYLPSGGNGGGGSGSGGSPAAAGTGPTPVGGSDGSASGAAGSLAPMGAGGSSGNSSGGAGSGMGGGPIPVPMTPPDGVGR